MPEQSAPKRAPLLARIGLVADFQWWLLKRVLRWYVSDHMRYSFDADKWKEIYVGINCGGLNGSDERHLAYINREDQ